MAFTARLFLLTIPTSTWLMLRYTSTSSRSWTALLYLISSIFLHLSMAQIYFASIYPYYISPLRTIPTPPDCRFFGGHTKAFLSQPIGQSWRDWFDEFARNDAPVLRFISLFNTERLIMVGPAAAADVLVHRCYDFEKPKFIRNNSIILLGDGLVFSEADVHKQQRKTLVPTFAYRKVKDLYPLFWERAGRMVSAIEEQGKRGKVGEKEQEEVIVVEAMEWASKAAVSIIHQAALGVDLGAIEDPEETFTACYRKVMGPGWGRHLVAFLGLIFPPSIVAKIPNSFTRRINQLDASIRELCATQMSLINAEKTTNTTSLGNTILGAAVSSQLFSLTEIVEQMKTFLLAGHETTATGLAWAVYLLTQHPEMQKRLRDELIQAQLPLPSSNSITASQIDSLPYLNAFTSEVLRLYPPVPATIRESIRPTSIAGHAIPPGVLIMILPWASNTSTGYWGTDPDPRQFNPDRWLQPNSNGINNSSSSNITTSTPSGNNLNSASQAVGNGGAVSNYSSQTFLHGPRSCIGERFARGELACLLACWALNFDTELVPDLIVDKDGNETQKEIKIDLTSGITARPVGGVKVRLRKV